MLDWNFCAIQAENISVYFSCGLRRNSLGYVCFINFFSIILIHHEYYNMTIDNCNK